MPRFNHLKIKDFRLLEENVFSYFGNSEITKKGFSSDNLFNDIKLGWDGDLILSEEEQDLKSLNELESFIQRLALYIITQKGTLPDDFYFGTSLENFIGSPDNNVDLQTLAFLLKQEIEEFEDVEYVDEVIGRKILTEDGLALEFIVFLKPKNFSFKMSIIFEA